MNELTGSQLGRASAYVDHYDASLLYPIARQPKRAELGLVGALPFLGADVWTAFELSWLGPRGKPQLALAHITVPCESTHIIESKSLKLYLNSFNNTRFADADAVKTRLRAVRACELAITSATTKAGAYRCIRWVLSAWCSAIRRLKLSVWPT